MTFDPSSVTSVEDADAAIAALIEHRALLAAAEQNAEQQLRQELRGMIEPLQGSAQALTRTPATDDEPEQPGVIDRATARIEQLRELRQGMDAGPEKAALGREIQCAVDVRDTARECVAVIRTLRDLLRLELRDL